MDAREGRGGETSGRYIDKYADMCQDSPFSEKTLFGGVNAGLAFVDVSIRAHVFFTFLTRSRARARARDPSQLRPGVDHAALAASQGQAFFSAFLPYGRLILPPPTLLLPFFWLPCTGLSRTPQ